MAGNGDFNGDGRSDILWRNGDTGENYVYFMDGLNILPTEGYVRTVADLDWAVAGTGDYNGDGTSDILWRHRLTGENYLFPMDGLSILASEGYTRTVADQSWQPVYDTEVRFTGDSLRNRLMGMSSGDRLEGRGGNDVLDGREGNDTLVGGAGDDTYKLGRGYGADLIQENDATPGNADVGQFLAGIARDQIWFRQLGSNLEVSVIGTGDAFTIEDWYAASAHRVEEFKTASGDLLLEGQVQNLLNAMAAFAPPAPGQTTLPSTYAAELNPVIAANWQ
jgi:Ca2+-binding RTX toxin-like protein